MFPPGRGLLRPVADLLLLLTEWSANSAEQVLVRFGDDFRRVQARYAGPEVELTPDAQARTIFGVEGGL